MKTLVIILSAFAVFASLETGVKANYNLMGVNSYEQIEAAVQGNNAFSKDCLMAKVTNDSTIDEPRTFQSNGDDDDDEDGDEDKKDNGAEGSPNRLWDVVGLG